MRRKSNNELKRDKKRAKREYLEDAKIEFDNHSGYVPLASLTLVADHEEQLRALFKKLKSDKKEQKEINSQLYTLFNGSLGVEDKGELRTKINRAHDRISSLEKSLKEASDNVSILLAATMMSMLFSVITLIVVY